MINPITQLVSQKPFLKVIAGIENFDSQSVKDVALAADKIAPAIDISCDEELIQWVRANTSLITFVSSLDPKELHRAAEVGAHIVELGNFDPMYKRGQIIPGEQVLAWTRELQQLTQGSVPLCITIPGVLSIEEQVDLALQLQAAGADMLQVENVRQNLDHVKAIREAVEIPVLFSGKLTLENLSEALQFNIEGFGVGHAIRQQGSVEQMQTYIQKLQQSAKQVLIG